MADFFHMGGYAVFVWSAYGISTVALVWLAVSSLRASRTTRKRVETLRARRRKEG